MIVFGLAALAGALLYWLYRQGFASTKCITAIMFVFRAGKHGDRAALNSCSGWVQHAGRFRESGIYEFHFDSQLSNGEAEVLLLDARKQELLRMNRLKHAGTLEVDGKSRYYLYWVFKSATGRCELHW